MNAEKASRTAVAVFGHSKADAAGLAQAEQAGRLLARNGYTVVNGGYGGTMEACARGALAEGGQVVGVTCRVWPGQPNPHLTRHIITETLPQRLGTLIELAGGGFVVLPGGTGTLLELAMVWELMNKTLIQPRPIVCLGESWRPVVETVVRVQPEAAARVSFCSIEELGGFFPPVPAHARR